MRRGGSAGIKNASYFAVGGATIWGRRGLILFRLCLEPIKPLFQGVVDRRVDRDFADLGFVEYADSAIEAIFQSRLQSEVEGSGGSFFRFFRHGVVTLLLTKTLNQYYLDLFDTYTN